MEEYIDQRDKLLQQKFDIIQERYAPHIQELSKAVKNSALRIFTDTLFGDINELPQFHSTILFVAKSNIDKARNLSPDGSLESEHIREIWKTFPKTEVDKANIFWYPAYLQQAIESLPELSSDSKGFV